jgi:hypothetical protein
MAYCKRIRIRIHMGNRTVSQWKCNDILDRCSYKVRQGLTVLLSRNIIAGGAAAAVKAGVEAGFESWVEE